jgi:hypothetical protein
VIDVGNHGHVPDIELIVHDGTHLLSGEIYLYFDYMKEKKLELSLWKEGV